MFAEISGRGLGTRVWHKLGVASGRRCTGTCQPQQLPAQLVDSDVRLTEFGGYGHLELPKASMDSCMVDINVKHQHIFSALQ